MPEQQLILDRYRIVGRAGAGGYATVQHAFDTRLKRDVAIKCIQLSQTQAVKARVSVNGAAAYPFEDPYYGESALDIIGAAAAGMHDDAASPDLPHDPGFLSKREERLARQAQRRASKTRREYPRDTGLSPLPSRKLSEYGRSGYGDDPLAYPFAERIGAPRNTIHLSDYSGRSKDAYRGGQAAGMAFLNERSAGGYERSGDSSADSIDIARLASVLPGSISGAGHTEIAGIDSDAVEVDIVEEATNDAGHRGPVAPYGGYDERDFDGESAYGSAYRNSYDYDDDYYEDTYTKTTPLMGGMPSSIRDDRSERSKDPSRTSATRTPSKAEDSAPPAPVPPSSDAIPGLEEARTAAHLNDANIVTVYDCVVEGTMAYVIMEYVEGKTLARMMRELENDITLDMITSVFLSVSHALEVAHKAGVLHLDIKPENVIINRDGLVKVADFGLSTLMDASGQGTTGGGTIGYMPLEQMRQQPLDVRTDEWALASLTYEMLSGANPFRARTLEGAEAAIENAELVLPSRFWDIDEEIDDILFAALDPDLDERYETIQDFADDLAPYLGNAKDGKKQLAEIVINGIGEEGEYGDARAASNDDAPAASPRSADGARKGLLAGLFGGRGANSGSQRDRDEDRGRDREAQSDRESRSASRSVRMSFADWLATRGLAIIARVIAALSAAMVGAISLMNFRLGFNEGASALSAQAYSATYGDASLFGMFTVAPVVAWILMAVFVAGSFIWPRFGMPVVYLTLVVSLLFNQAWSAAFLLLFVTGVWWWLLGRKSDRDCSIAMMQPLFGSFGFASLVAPIAGAMLDVRESIGACFMAAIGAIVFASFGSIDVMNWEIWSNFVVAVNPSIAGASIMDGLVRTFSDPSTWAIVISWILGAATYSLFCWRGTKTFDILGSIVCAAFIVLGVVFAPLILGTGEPLSPMRIAGSLIPALVGILFAFSGIPDAVRTEYDDYEFEEE